MLNSVILIGRLTADPELRYTTNGIAASTFSLAVERPFANQEGKREADFIRIVSWRKLAEVVAQNLGKGRLVAVQGRLQVRSYDDKEGKKRSISEVVAENIRFLDWPKDGQQQGAGQGQRPQAQGQGQAANPFGGVDPFGDIDFGDDFPL